MPRSGKGPPGATSIAASRGMNLPETLPVPVPQTLVQSPATAIDDAIPGFNVYLAFSMFRLASIGQGVFKRNLIGIGNAPASGDNAHTKHLAATACAILDR